MLAFNYLCDSLQDLSFLLTNRPATFEIMAVQTAQVPESYNEQRPSPPQPCWICREAINKLLLLDFVVAAVVVIAT